jgi:hypothetical protein
MTGAISILHVSSYLVWLELYLYSFMCLHILYDWSYIYTPCVFISCMTGAISILHVSSYLVWLELYLYSMCLHILYDWSYIYYHSCVFISYMIGDISVLLHMSSYLVWLELYLWSFMCLHILYDWSYSYTPCVFISCMIGAISILLHLSSYPIWLEIYLYSFICLHILYDWNYIYTPFYVLISCAGKSLLHLVTCSFLLTCPGNVSQPVVVGWWFWTVVQETDKFRSCVVKGSFARICLTENKIIVIN